MSEDNAPEEINPQLKQAILENDSAIKIQRVWRGYNYRRRATLIEFQNHLALKIQRVWRAYRIRKKMQNVKEIWALVVISKAVTNFRYRLRAIRVVKKLQKYEPVLAYYPTQSNPPDPPTKGRKGRRGRRGGGGGGGGKKGGGGGKGVKRGTGGRSGTRRDIPQPLMIDPSKYKEKRSGPPMKRKYIIELPPPWHDKNPARISQTQQAEMLYEQKNTIAWVKSEVVPMLIRNFNPLLDLRDDLLMKNEKFKNRMVQKPFVNVYPRAKIALRSKIPKDIKIIRDTAIYTVVTLGAVSFIETSTITDDKIIRHESFDKEKSLFDIEIHTESGLVAGLDTNWVLRIFSRDKTIISRKFPVEVTIPKAKKYIYFDKFGMLWVNLFPQKGNLLLVDPLTLQIAIQVNLDNISSVHRNMRSVVSLQPISLKKPVGFVGVFNGTDDVFLFSTDFTKSKKIHQDNMTGIPNAKLTSNHLLVWWKQNTVFVYEIKDTIDIMTLTGKFTTPASPTDIAASYDPDIFFVACEDQRIYTYLSGDLEFPLRLGTNKMTRVEMSFADQMLGPMTYTKSRGAFKELVSHYFPNVPIKIDAMRVSRKLVLLVVAFPNGSATSLWYLNEEFTVKCCEFDELEHDNPQESKDALTEEFNRKHPRIKQKRQSYKSTVEFIEQYDSASTKGQIQNLFQPKQKTFSLTKYLVGFSLKPFFYFIPDTPPTMFSAYEVFHFMYRAGLLPYNISNFAAFLQHFAPKEVQKTLPPVEVVVNPKLPVITSGYYNACVDLPFTPQQIQEFILKLNPLDCLKQLLSIFTITKASENLVDAKATTSKRWICRYERNELNKRMAALTLLEDAVKHELMGRVQKNIDNAFRDHLLDRMQSVSSIDIHPHLNTNDPKFLEFSKNPNRNPLLDTRAHRSIYEVWSTDVQFSRDKTIPVDLKALYIPNKMFALNTVTTHFEFVRRVAAASKKITSEVFAITDQPNNVTQMIITEDSRALPLSHYLSIHSYLGANSRLLLAARTICARTLTLLYQLHKNDVIVRTICPDNILLNAQTGVVSIGNVYDCQLLATNSRANYLPLPPNFSHYSNPYLPPEFYHEPPRRYTTAFDVWQFGIQLLYILTGFYPVSYGTELMKHIEDESNMALRRVMMVEPNALDDPPLYPRINFFYDWLKGYKIVNENDKFVGDAGECFITTDRPGIPSILELDHYKLLPYKNTRVNYDEARIFLEIIASCLQVDPEKRPKVEDLLRTYPFNQTNQIGDILDQYMRQPDPKVFVAQFFTPTLKTMCESSFRFTLGIISALVFHEEMAEEDVAYAFPLDTRAAEQVIRALFEVKFMDMIIMFVLKEIMSKITYSSVNPTISFKNEMFSGLIYFLQRFVTAIEHGQGSLLAHVDEVIMSLLALYTGNSHLRHLSSTLLERKIPVEQLTSSGSAALFMFTHVHARNLVQYALQGSTYISNALKRSVEHNDLYFQQFLSFGDNVYSFASSMCHSIEKQRSNSVLQMQNLWAGGTQTHIVRLFIDFQVPQMVLHCMINSGCRYDASAFVGQMLESIWCRSFEPTYILMNTVLTGPTLIHQCGIVLKCIKDEDTRQNYMDIISHIIFGQSSYGIISLMVDDIFWYLADNSCEPIYNEFLSQIFAFSNKFVLSLIQNSSGFIRTVKANKVKMLYRDDNIPADDLDSCILGARRYAAMLFIHQNSLPPDLNQLPQLDEPVNFLMKAIKTAFAASIDAADVLDDQVLYDTRFDLKGTTYLKAKTTARNTSFSTDQSSIIVLCNTLLHLFRCLCFYWREPGSPYPRHFFQFILDQLVGQIPLCQSMPHPASNIHCCLQQMVLFCLTDLPEKSPAHEAVICMQDIWPKIMLRDIMFLMQCVDKDIVEMQLVQRYPEERKIRMKMFQTIITDPQIANLAPLLRFIVNNMLHNLTQFNGTLAVAYPYPIRTEAVNMIMFVLGIRDKYEGAAKRLVDELMITNFVDEEKKLTDSDDDQQLANSSILLLRMITQCNTIFEEKTLKFAQTQLEKLCMRFSRDWLSIASIGSDGNMKRNGGTTIRGSVSTARAPSRKSTTITRPASGLSSTVNKSMRATTNSSIGKRNANSASLQNRPKTSITVRKTPRKT